MSRKKTAEQKLVEVVKEIGLDRVMSNLKMLELSSNVTVEAKPKRKPVVYKPEEKAE